VTPVLRQVVLTALHMTAAGLCPILSWSLLTRVVVLRAISCILALFVLGA